MTDEAKALVERCKGHTPGPWKMVQRGTDWHIVGRPAWGCEYYGQKGRWAVAALDDMIVDEYPAEAKANAHLIAAAPNLLDLIETQAREIERLREALQDSARALDASNVLIHALSGAPSVMVETFAERTRAALAGDSHD